MHILCLKKLSTPGRRATHLKLLENQTIHFKRTLMTVVKVNRRTPFDFSCRLALRYLILIGKGRAKTSNRTLINGLIKEKKSEKTHTFKGVFQILIGRGLFQFMGELYTQV